MGLEAHCELRGHGVIVITWTRGFLLKTILQLQLGVWREAVARRDIDPPEVLAPATGAS